MKKGNISIFSLLLLTFTCYTQFPDHFDKYFTDKTMRIDCFHIGDAKEEMATIDQAYEQGSWAGSLNNLIDTFHNGRYSVKIYDLSSDTLIFSKGFDSFFGKYKTTDVAIKGVKRTCHETALIYFCPSCSELFSSREPLSQFDKTDDFLQPLFVNFRESVIFPAVHIQNCPRLAVFIKQRNSDF